jgi:hypothetical protein
MKYNSLKIQLIFILVFISLIVIFQTILFKTKENSWIDAIFTKQWLWLIYFWCSHILVERVCRKDR